MNESVKNNSFHENCPFCGSPRMHDISVNGKIKSVVFECGTRDNNGTGAFRSFQCAGKDPRLKNNKLNVDDMYTEMTDFLKTNIINDEMKNEDAVNHPRHYTGHPSGVECIAITRHMSFNLGNVVKYLWRAGKKDSSKELEDLKKARFYLDDEIKRLESVQ